MKRASTQFYLLFSLFILFSASLFSQDRCPYKGPQQPANLFSTTVGNFTITDTQGNTYDLYETLDSGKTVFIDLFYTRCGYCQQYAPIIEQVYLNSGEGEEDILMWGISDDSYDTNPIIDQYKADYSITNPCAGPQGGGDVAHTVIISGQNFLGWPTYCVICPDRNMYFDPVYPPTVTGFGPYFEQCAAVVAIDEPIKGFSTQLTSLYPNPVNDVLFVDIALDKASSSAVELFDLTGSSVLKMEYQLQAGTHTLSLDLSSFTPGYYFLKFSQNGIFKEIKRVIIL